MLLVPVDQILNSRYKRTERPVGQQGQQAGQADFKDKSILVITHLFIRIYHAHSNNTGTCFTLVQPFKGSKFHGLFLGNFIGGLISGETDKG